MQAIRIHSNGGPEVMQLDELEAPAPGTGHVLVEVEAAGVNFIDVYMRTGQYPTPKPMTLGFEGAGRVVAVGEGADLEVGARVAWSGLPGSYATHVIAPGSQLVPVPDGVTTEQAAAVMLQGMTAHYLTRSSFALGPEHTCLVHAAAGGVGLLLCQMAKGLGARVIGTASTEAKAERARAAGADEMILYTETTFAPEVKRLTDGLGVDVVYDSVGQATFMPGLDCLVPRGTMVLYGQSSGPVESFDPQLLNRKGSLFLTRPSLFHHVATRDELLARAGDVLGWVAAGELDVEIDRTLPLAKAGEAHTLLEGRKTMGKLLLVPTGGE